MDASEQIQVIKSLLDTIEVKGIENMTRILVCAHKCDELAKALSEAQNGTIEIQLVPPNKKE